MKLIKKKSILNLSFTCLKYKKNDYSIFPYYACGSNIDNSENIFVLQSNFCWTQFNLIQEKEIKYVNIKNDENLNEYDQYLKLNNKDFIKKPLFKGLMKNKYLIISGYNDGSIIVMTQNRNINKKDEINTKETIDKKQFIEIRKVKDSIFQIDNSIITCIEKSQNEKLLFFGTENGSLLIYKNKSTEENISISFIILIHNHTKKINSIHCNNILNMFIDCSDDGYVNLYTLPKFNFVKSFYFNNSIIDYIFLSSHSLPSFVTISNSNGLIESYSINGKLICSKKIEDITDSYAEDNNNIKDNDFNYVNYAIFVSDAWFRDYIIYIVNNIMVFVREIPLLEDRQSFYIELNEAKFNLIIPSDNENEFKFYFISDDARSFILYK